jgi:phosphoglycolate phosphatase
MTRTQRTANSPEQWAWDSTAARARLDCRLILFDFDFTLVDASRCLFAALRAGLSAVGSPEPTDEQMRMLIGLPLRDQFSRLRGPVQSSQYQHFRVTYHNVRDSLQFEGTILLAGVSEALDWLARTYLLGIVSTGNETRIIITLNRFAIDGFFRGGVIAGANNKARAIATACHRLCVPPPYTLYVGDRPEDALAARSACVMFVGVTTGIFQALEFPEHTQVLPSVASLPEFMDSGGKCCAL